MSAIQLTQAQRAAIEHPGEPLLVVAGAGSGKTHVMAARIVHLVRQGTPARRILGLTFSNKAAGNLRARVVAELGAGEDVSVSTYHGFGASLVLTHADLLGLGDDLRLLDKAQGFQLLLDVFDEFRFLVRKTGMPLNIVGDALVLASRAGDHLVSVDGIEADCARLVADLRLPDVIRETATKRAELLPLIRAYTAQKRQLGLLDHDDQIGMAVRLLQEHPELADELRRTYPVVLLDEYQDTNFAQRRLLQLIYPPGSAITAVGDDMQSIYAFRGAHVRNLHDFAQHFAATGQAVALELSFRNDRRILDLANRIQAQVPSAQTKLLESREDASNGDLVCFLASDEREEAVELARRALELHANGTPWPEIAVLCRKRRLIAPIVEAFSDAGVPVEVIGMGGLMSRPEVVELIAWLEVLSLPDPAVALLRLLTGPRYRIGTRDLSALSRHGGLAAGLEELHTITGLSAEAYQRLGRFVEERARLRDAAHRLALVDLCEEVLAVTGLWDVLDGERPVENLARLLHAAEQFRPIRGRRSLAEFLEWLHVLAESEEDLAEAVSGDTDAVQVMTIHQAKGLEFDHVMVPGLAGSGLSHVFPDANRYQNPVTQATGLPLWLREDNEGITEPPRTKAAVDAAKAQAKEAQLDEEWRLLYVAVTRARHGLVLSAAHRYAGVDKAQGPSKFYRFVASQTDLVRETFQHGPAPDDPGVDAMRRRATAAEKERQLAASVPHAAAEQIGFELAAPAAAPVLVAPPRSLPVTALVSLGRCPRQFHWTHVRPMPRRASAAAQLGTAVHRWIEERAGRQLSLFPDPSADDEPVGSGLADDTGDVLDAADRQPSREKRLRDSFLASPYAALDPVRVEHPVALASGTLLLRGRVDAAYQHQGVLDVVDFKTGRLPFEGEGGTDVQLDLYGLAAVDTWGADPSALRTSTVHLRADGPPIVRSTQWTPDRVPQVRAAFDAAAASISAGVNHPRSGPWCAGCPVGDFCAEGRPFRVEHP